MVAMAEIEVQLSSEEGETLEGCKQDNTLVESIRPDPEVGILNTENDKEKNGRKDNDNTSDDLRESDKNRNEVDIDDKSDCVEEGNLVQGVETGNPGSNEQENLQEDHLRKESELEEYLESLKPKPKRKSIKEMLMSLPGYKDLASMKPKIGGDDGKKKEIIILDDEVNKRTSARVLKRQQQIEALKDRFVRHCITAPIKSGKGDHVKLKIKKKEEDSQGIEHLVENEVDYVRNPLNADEEAGDFLTPIQNSSPQSSAPGVSRRRLQDTLMEKIRAQKKKDHEERVKDFNMYNDEKDEDKDDEEIMEDEEASEDDSSSEEDEDKEADLEDLLASSTKKKKRSKSAFVDDEAEDEDDNDADDDDDDEDESSEDDSEADENDNENKEGLENGENVNDAAKIEVSMDSDPSVPVECDNEKTSPMSTPAKSISNDDSQRSLDCGGDYTPKVTTAVLNQRTPSDFWIPAKSNSNIRQVDELSPLIPRINRSQIHEVEQLPSTSAVPKSLANIISEPKVGFDALVGLCSGRFVSQGNTDSTQSQEDEYDGFDFGDDDETCAENNDNDKETLKTPKAGSAKTAIDGITPKLCEKVPKTRLLMQFEEEAEKTIEGKDKVDKRSNSNSNLEDDEEEIIGMRIKGRKQKRLQFSDDEDENDGPEVKVEDSQIEQELSAESEEEAEEVSQEITLNNPTSKNPFFNKRGLLKKKFVEDEAELSGSEEGSDDEDERGLNHYEMEEGDEEEIDEIALRNQVERAHLKRLLDDDDREIRRLQNAYLENGDLHTDKQRERKFTWKFNMNELNDDAHFGDSDEDHADENPEDSSLKQAWIDKRKWMSENSHLLEAGEDESQSLLCNSRFSKMSKNAIKRLESFVDTSTSDSSNVVIKETSFQRRSIYQEIIKTKCASKKKDVDLTSCSEGMNAISHETDTNQSNKSMSQPLFGETTTIQKNVSMLRKGSFLSRGGVMLAKFAEVSKPGDAVSNVKNNSRNFVFQHITPPNQDKTDGSTSRVKRALPATGKQAATKKVKIDRSFSNLDEASKGASIFKWL